MTEITLGSEGMTLEDLVVIARKEARVRLAEQAVKMILAARKLVDKWVKEGKVVYGVTTGFGALSDVAITKDETRQLQQNLLMSHAAGVGPVLDAETVRAVMALRAKDLARGNSGIRVQTVERLIDLLNRGVYPVVPEKGSVGASGDLAPLAHLGLVMIGLGEAFYKGEKLKGAEALKRCGLKPLELQAGEGVALVNGTQVMTAIGGLATYDALCLSRTADVAAAMSLEVLMGSRPSSIKGFTRLDPIPARRPRRTTWRG